MLLLDSRASMAPGLTVPLQINGLPTKSQLPSGIHMNSHPRANVFSPVA
jgi:hypothetical protein